ncbi:unnamed protein product, partial [Discosporangium mesarthrocarpum]
MQSEGAKSKQTSFERSVARVNDLNAAAVGKDYQLQLYGLFKQATIGDCRTPRPGMFDPRARMKWDSWKSLSGLTNTVAMEQYSQLADRLCPPAHSSSGSGHAPSPSLEQAGGTTHRGKDCDGRGERGGEKLEDIITEGGTLGPSSQEPGVIDKVCRPPESGRGYCSSSTLWGRGMGGERRMGSACYGSVSSDCNMERRGRPSWLDLLPPLLWSSPGVVTVAVVLLAMALGGSRGACGFIHIPGLGLLGIGLSQRGLFWVIFAGEVITVSVALLWAAVRVARWREGVFSGSPLVEEVLSLERKQQQQWGTYLHEGGGAGCSTPVEGSVVEHRGQTGQCMGEEKGGKPSAGVGADPGAGTGAGGARVKQGKVADPVGDIFGPGTEAGEAFGVGSCPENGAVVFLTGVTGLVGRMVLYDLLKQGHARNGGAGAIAG